MDFLLNSSGIVLKDTHLASALPATGFILASPFLLPPASSWGWPRLGTVIILLSPYVLGLYYRCFVCSVIYPLTRVSHGGFIFNCVRIFNRHFILHNCIFKYTLYLCIYVHSFCADNIHFFHAEEPTEEKTTAVSCLMLAGEM